MLAAPVEVTITEKVYDLFFVDILNKTFLYQSFDYEIRGEDKKTVRRGTFRAPSVQLRTNNLAEGKYQFQLYLEGKEWQSTSFIKNCNSEE